MANQDFPSDFDINDSDSDTTSMSSTASENFASFEPVQPLVLELHEIRKDSTSPPPLEAVAPPSEIEAAPVEVKTKKLKKKKRLGHSDPQTVSSTSNTQIQSRSETTEEEFFDAQGSLHILPENQEATKAVAAPTLQPSQAQPEQPLLLLPPNTALTMRSSIQAHPPAAAPPVITAMPLIPTSQSESTVPTAPVTQPPLAPAQSDHGPSKGSHTTTTQPPSTVERPTTITKPTKRTE